MHSMYIHYLK